MAITEVLRISTEAKLRALDDAIDTVNDYGDSLSNIEQDGARAEKGAKKADGAFSKLSKSAGGALKVLAGFGAVAAVGGLVAIGTQVVGWTDAMKLASAQTGLMGDELADFKEQAQDVFTANWGDSIDDAAQSMATVERITKSSGDELETLTRNAIILRDIFDKDVTESTRAANTMMEQFGISGEEAFDLIAWGLQQTGDPADDLLDTFNEYAGNFKDLGLTADQVMRLIQTGMAGGARNTDDIADATREYGIRLKEGLAGNEDWRTAFLKLGKDAGGVLADLEGGYADGADALQFTLDMMRAMDDPIARNALGVELFGTKFEDMGFEAFQAMSLAGGAIEDAEGAMDSIDATMSAGFIPAMKTASRVISVFLSKGADKLFISLSKRLSPSIKQLIKSVKAFGNTIKLAGGLVNFLNGTLSGVAIEGFLINLGLSQEVAKELGNTLSGVIRGVVKLWSIFREFVVPKALIGLQSIFEAMKPLVIAFVNEIKNIVSPKGLTEIEKSASSIHEVLGVAVPIIAEFIWELGRITLPIALGLIKAGFLILKEIVPIVLAAILGGMVLLTAAFKKARPHVIAFMDKLNEIIIPKAIENIKIGLKAIWDVLKLIAPPIANFIKALGKIVVPLAITFLKFQLESLKAVFNSIVVPIAKFIWKLGKIVVPLGLKVIKNAIRDAKWAFENIIEPIAKFVLKLGKIGLPFGIHQIRTAIINIKDAFFGALLALGSFITKIGQIKLPWGLGRVRDVASGISLFFSNAATAVWNFINALRQIKVPTALSTISSGISSFVGGVSSFFGGGGGTNTQAAISAASAVQQAVVGITGAFRAMPPGFAHGTPWTGNMDTDQVAGAVHGQEAVVPASGMTVFPSPGGLQLAGAGAGGNRLTHIILQLDKRTIYEAMMDEAGRRID